MVRADHKYNPDQKLLKYFVRKKGPGGPNLPEIFGPAEPNFTRTEYFVTDQLQTFHS